jgi:hypothetical protein
MTRDDSERSGEGATPSENERATEGSLDELSDEIKTTGTNVHVVKFLNFHFIQVYFPSLFTLNVF